MCERTNTTEQNPISDQKTVAFVSEVNRNLPMTHDNEETPLMSFPGSSKGRRWHSMSTRASAVWSTQGLGQVPRSIRPSKSCQSIASVVKSHGLSPHGISLHSTDRLYYDNYSCIDWNKDNVQSRNNIAELRRLSGVRGRINYLGDAVQGWILCFLVGICTALFAYWIMISEAWLFSMKNGYCSSAPFTPAEYCPDGNFLYWSQDLTLKFFIYLLAAMSFTLMASGLTMLTLTVFPDSGKKVYMAAGSGIPEVKCILSGFILREFLGVKTLIVKMVALTLAVASGLNLGKEGPLVHISACVANILSRAFPKFSSSESKRREILSSACSAGVAVAFGAPIGGVLFALEEVSYYFPPKVMARSFFTAAVAAVTLKMLNPLGTGKLILLETDFGTTWHVAQLPFFIAIGVLGGLYGAMFCYLNIAWAKSFRRTTLVVNSPIIECAMICLLTTIVSYWNEWTFLGGTELLSMLLSKCSSGDLSALCANSNADYISIIRSLASALVIKVLLTIITFGIRLPAGIFIPTMCIGALFGRIFGLLIQQIHLSQKLPGLFTAFCETGVEEHGVIPGTYAMLGAAAALAGVTRMTVSLAAIMFELTGSLDYVLPFMISILCAKWVAEAIQPQGIYDLIIQMNDLPYLDIKAQYDLQDMSILDLLPSKIVVHNTSIDVSRTSMIKASQLRSMICWAQKKAYEDSGFAIVRDQELIGYVALADLSLALDLLPSGDEGGDEMDPEILIGPDRTGVQSASSSISSEGADVWQGNLESGSARINDFRHIVDKAPLSLSKEASIGLAFEMFSKLGLRYLAVNANHEFLGVVHKKTFVSILRSGSRRE